LQHKITYATKPSGSTFIKGQILTNKSLASGQPISISLPASGKVNIGTRAIGFVWGEYTTEQNSSIQYVQMASIGVNAS
jgi:hypothetical protein